MHTSFFDSCVINHNGDYYGEIYINNTSDQVTRIGEPVRLKTTTKALINIFKSMKGKSKYRIVTGKDEETSKPTSMRILTKDVESYIECILLDKIQDKMDNVIKLDKIFQIAEILKVKI